MVSNYLDRIKKYFEADRLTVIFSFTIIFAFSTVDHAISPLIDAIHRYYGISLERGLELISYCTLGIVTGIFIGPAIMRAYKAAYVFTVSSALLLVSLLLFLGTSDFHTALLLRFFFGISAGVLSTTMWWMAYHGVGKKYYNAAITVLMASRPLAVALGVPATGIIASAFDWKRAFWICGFMIFVSIVVLHRTMANDDEQKVGIDFGNFFSEYSSALKIPNAFTLYLGLMINKMCYFGFYSLAGIWFIRHYGLDTLKITLALMYIGLAETFINFFIPKIIQWGGQKQVFTWSIILSNLVFIILIPGFLALKIAVFCFAVFAMLDRIYSMSIVILIPELFPECRNKSVMGSLITLSSWFALTIISWIEGKYLDVIGMASIEALLFISLAGGSAILYYIVYKAVYKRGATGGNLFIK